MKQAGSTVRGAAIPQPPSILIFFHIPKTGGTTMDAILSRCFPGPQHFDGQVGTSPSGLSIRPREKIEAKYHARTVEQRQAIRCVMGTHYPMGIDSMLDRPAKYFTILRPPVERVASHFFDDRTQKHLPCHERIKNMTLEDYLDSGLGITPFDNQVRLLSGCPELDTPWDPAGGPISAPPVERRHLDLAKRNIEDRFITAAPLESFTTLLMMLRRIYGWRLQQLLFVKHNVGAARPFKTEPISAASRRRLEDSNRYDTELYEWAKTRFAEQMRSFEPELSRDRARFELLNAATQRLDRTVPASVRKLASRVLFPHHAA